MAYNAYQASGSHQGKMFGAAHQGAGPNAASDPNYLLQILRHTVQEQVRPSPFVALERLIGDLPLSQKIGAFYPAGSLEQISQKVVREGSLQRIAQQWQLPLEAAIDLVRLALFDIVIYADDSGSMVRTPFLPTELEGLDLMQSLLQSFEEKGSRINDLKMIVGRTAFAASLFDQDGIQVSFSASFVARVRR